MNLQGEVQEDASGSKVKNDDLNYDGVCYDYLSIFDNGMFLYVSGYGMNLFDMLYDMN